MTLKHRLIAWCFSPYMRDKEFKVVKVKGWGIFQLQHKTGTKMTVEFPWYMGLI